MTHNISKYTLNVIFDTQWQFLVNNTLVYTITVEQFLRVIKIQDSNQKLVCEVTMQGFFFFKKLSCNAVSIASNETYIFKNKSLTKKDLSIVYPANLAADTFVINNTETMLNVFPFTGCNKHNEISWRGDFTGLQMLLLICKIVAEFTLNSPRN